MLRMMTMVLLMACAVLPARADDRDTCFSIGTQDYKDKNFYAIGLAACERALATRQLTNIQKGAYYRQMGDWKRRMGDLQAALEDFGRAIEMNPKDHENFDYRAEVWVALKNDDRALADFNAATRLKPEYPAAYLGRGDVYRRRGDLKSAEEEYRKVLARPVKDRIDAWAHDEARSRLEAMKSGNRSHRTGTTWMA